MRWLAALALVPAVAWGDCYSVDTREGFIGFAQELMATRDAGISESSVLEVAMSPDSPPHERAAMLEAVRVVYGPLEPSLSSIAASMANACAREMRR